MAPRVLYLVSEDWYFVSHRLPMARAALRAGFEVHVATRVARHGGAIEHEGFILHPLNLRRGSLNPGDLLTAVREVRRLYRQLSPDLVHHVALMPSVVGSLAALGLPIVCLNALAGLGFAFTTHTAKAIAIRAAIKPMLGGLLNRKRAFVLVQNPDDRAAMLALGISAGKITLIPGSGVDVDTLQPLPEPPPPVVAGFVGRLLTDKGLPALMEAHALLSKRGRPVALLIAGEPDPANPASISPAVLADWQRRPGLNFLGHVGDIGAFWSRAHIAVLPSLREGLPMSLLEAAACARPLVATDVPGCREIARDGINAVLVPPNNATALADAIERLADDADLRRRFAAASRRMVEDEFSHLRVGKDIVALYQRLLS